MLLTGQLQKEGSPGVGLRWCRQGLRADQARQSNEKVSAWWTTAAWLSPPFLLGLVHKRGGCSTEGTVALLDGAAGHRGMSLLEVHPGEGSERHGHGDVGRGRGADTVCEGPQEETHCWSWMREQLHKLGQRAEVACERGLHPPSGWRACACPGQRRVLR